MSRPRLAKTYLPPVELDAGGGRSWHPSPERGHGNDAHALMFTHGGISSPVCRFMVPPVYPSSGLHVQRRPLAFGGPPGIWTHVSAAPHGAMTHESGGMQSVSSSFGYSPLMQPQPSCVGSPSPTKGGVHEHVLPAVEFPGAGGGRSAQAPSTKRTLRELGRAEHGNSAQASAFTQRPSSRMYPTSQSQLVPSLTIRARVHVHRRPSTPSPAGGLRSVHRVNEPHGDEMQALI